MPSTESNRKKDARIKKIAKEMAREAIEEKAYESEPELAPDINFSSDDLGDSDEPGAYYEGQIFENGQKLMDEGDYPKYSFKKDNDYVAEKKGKYDLESMQRDLGPGQYTVYLKRSSNGKIVQQKRINIAENPFTKKPSNEFDEERLEPITSKTDELLKLATFMKTFNGDTEAKIREASERAEQRAREAAEKADRESRRSVTEQSTLLTTMLQMMQQTTQQSQTLFLEMMKSMNESNNKMFERINSKIDGATNKKEGLDTATLIKMLQDSEDRGYQRRRDIDELAEERADRRIEELEAKGDEKPEGLITSLAKSFLPVISSAVQQHQANQPTPQQQLEAAQAEEARRLQFQRDEDARAKAAHQRAVESGIRRPTTQNRTNPAQNAKRPGQTAPQGQPNGQSRGTGAQKVNPEVKRDGLGLPVAAQPSQPVQTPVMSKEKLNGTFKSKVADLVFPILAESLVGGAAPQFAAQKSWEVLTKAGFDRKEVVENFSLKDIIEIAAQNGVPKEANPWFEAYWKSILEGVMIVQSTTGTQLEPQTVGTGGTGPTA